MPGACTKSWWRFPPHTRELQLDEKWAFVRRKRKNCDLEKIEDHDKGDCWDHVAFDAEHRLVLGVIPAKRSASAIKRLLERVKEQLGGHLPRLISSDEFGAYATVLKLVWPRPPRKKKQKKQKRWLNYAMVCKKRENGRVVQVKNQVVFGSRQSVARALKQSKASSAINTSFLERHNATDRHRNARKARRTYRFSKDWLVHEAMTYFTYYTYNFCWCVRTLRGSRKRKGRYPPRTPAMTAKLTDHVWSLKEWLSYPMAERSN